MIKERGISLFYFRKLLLTIVDINNIILVELISEWR